MTINDLAPPSSYLSMRKPTHSGTNADKRPREYLKPSEVEAMRRHASVYGRYGARDAALILLSFRHGLRASEACGLDWAHVDWHAKVLTVRRAKGGALTAHPMGKDVVRALASIRAASGPLFVNERGGALSPAAVHKIVARAGKLAAIPFSVHPHMLRHACGYALANAGTDVRLIQAYLGHRSISSTVIYTQLAPGAFERLQWLE